MPLDLDLELRLDQRCEDHVLVSVLLAPNDDEAVLEGVSLQLYDGREPIGPRTLLPIAGVLRAPMLTSVELHAHDQQPIPPGCRVVATAWAGTEQQEATVPTDPGTAFAAHVRGVDPLGHLHIDPSRDFDVLEPEERAIFSALYPWIDIPRVPRAQGGQLEFVDHEPTTAETIADVALDLGLDEETASWLGDLLDED